ncbi:MAG: hypothetical protein ACW96S_04655, partial [Promethearchaeota archaeon]
FLPTALFFWGFTITRSVDATLILIVYNSMLPEQSQTLKNREKIASIIGMFRIIASVVALFLPLLVQSMLDDPQNVKWWDPSGKVILTYIPIMGILFTGFSLVTVLLVYFSVDERFHEITQDFEEKKISLTSVIGHMALPAKDKKYRLLVIADFIVSMGGFWGMLIFSFQTYVLNYRQSQFFIYILISIFGKLGWYILWRQVIKKKNDNQSLLNLYIINRFIGGMVSFLVLFFFLPNISSGASLVIYIIVFGTILGSNYSVTLFAIPINASLIHKAAEKRDSENLEKSISEISGIYYGFSTFMFSMGYSISTFLVGFILTGSNAENPVIILILIAVRGIFVAISLVFLRKLKFNEL